jgi:hypothetical protein
MAFRQGFLLGLGVGTVLTLLYTPLDGRDARAILLGPLGWQEFESEPEVAWTPATGSAAPAATEPTARS